MTRWWSALLLVLCSVVHAAPRPGEDNAILATKASLDAFFAMPVARPDGTDQTPSPIGFDGETADQDDLIAYLAAQRQVGARLDRYRHGGTLLHHSLRVRFNTVTAWLLAHGADPLQKLDDAAERLDALGVAVRLERWNWVSTLLRHPAYARLAPAEVAERLWAGAKGDAQLSALLRLRPAVPLPAPGTPTAQRLLVKALCSHQLPLAERLLAGQGAPITLDKQGCGQDETAITRAGPLDLPAWRALEPRFSSPLLPLLLPALHSPAELQAALAGGLRQAWAEPAFARAVLSAVPGELMVPLLLSAPSPRLWFAMDRRQGAVLLLNRPLAEWTAVVNAVPAGLGLQALLDAAADSAAPADKLARWQPLVQRINGLLPALRVVLTLPRLLLRELPPSFWVDGMAWAAEADTVPELLPAWITRAPLSEVQAAWPTLQRLAPRWTPELLAALLTPLQADPAPGRLFKAMQAIGVDDRNLATARWLRAQGLTVKPRALLPRFMPTSDGSPGSLSAWALAEGLVDAAGVVVADKTPSASLPPSRLQRVAALSDCRPVMSMALRRALARPVERQDLRRYDPALLQPLAAPGQAYCQWLRSESLPYGGGSWTEVSFFQGTHSFSQCSDGGLRLEPWDANAQSFVYSGLTLPEAMLVEAELQPDGERFWFALESGGSGCGTLPARAYRLLWQGPTPEFVPVRTTDPLDARWHAACAGRQVSECLGLVEGAQSLPREPQPVSVFVDQHWAADRTAFLTAFDALDRPRLAAQQRDGLFPGWLNAAAQALSDSTRTLPERRARMAWLLATPVQSQALSDDSLRTLPPWLPAEDWGPILMTRRCDADHGRYTLRALAKSAAPALKRRIAVALAMDCDGRVE